MSGSSAALLTILAAETLFEPAKGTFVPWSDGARVCPGKKFSQVEFVAVLSEVFREHEVQAVRQEGETQVEMRARILAAANDFAMRVSLQMKDPTAITLKLVPRHGEGLTHEV